MLRVHTIHHCINGMADHAGTSSCHPAGHPIQHPALPTCSCLFTSSKSVALVKHHLEAKVLAHGLAHVVHTLVVGKLLLRGKLGAASAVVDGKACGEEAEHKGDPHGGQRELGSLERPTGKGNPQVLRTTKRRRSSLSATPVFQFTASGARCPVSSDLDLRVMPRLHLYYRHEACWLRARGAFAGRPAPPRQPGLEELSDEDSLGVVVGQRRPKGRIDLAQSLEASKTAGHRVLAGFRWLDRGFSNEMVQRNTEPRCSANQAPALLDTSR